MRCPSADRIGQIPTLRYVCRSHVSIRRHGLFALVLQLQVDMSVKEPRWIIGSSYGERHGGGRAHNAQLAVLIPSERCGFRS